MTTPQATTMDDIELPPLPEPNEPPVFGYTSADLKAYARAAITADRATREIPSAQPAPIGLAPSRAGRLYLAGPMTGIAEFNFPAFNAAAAGLRASGIDVVNPAEHGIVEGAQWEDYLRFDIAKIAGCESIALLPGWSGSRGATLEVHIAQTLGMPVIYLAGAERAPAATQPAPTDAHVSLAHELWAAAQLAPGEGIADGADRVAAILATQPEGQEAPDHIADVNKMVLDAAMSAQAGGGK